jgi:hypothetical protein
MNKFTNPPDSLPGLLGCAFWLIFLSGAMTALVYVLARIGGR